MKQLENKTALITGASMGIGLATASLFTQMGASVIMVGRSKQNLTKAKDSIADNKNVEFFQADISQTKDLDKLYNHIAAEKIKLDIVFANAGSAARICINDATEEQFDNIVATNYKGTYFTIQKALAHTNPHASIILNSSIAGIVALESHTIYSSAKAALIQLAKTLAADLANKSIRVNSISPGYIKTPIWDQFLENEPEKYNSLCKNVPFEQRFGAAEEIAQAALFLASPASSYITAQNLVVDGGLSSIIPRHNEC